MTVACTTNNYTVGGTVSGLGSGKSVVLRNSNGNETLTAAANGPFTFVTPIPSESQYGVTVVTQPAQQTCTVSNGTGTVAAANVTSVSVVCSSSSFSVGGTLSGLASGKTITLLDNGGDPLPLSSDGTFAFSATRRQWGNLVTVGTSRPGRPAR